uniref:Uncharacterized protein n=1 Tax=Myotis myotis TaxID=51298 RepID=A0A7J7T6H9_MYOMY|nr:hypothetical protein mMyoMyo1_009149 [Myotis myotis]
MTQPLTSELLAGTEAFRFCEKVGLFPTPHAQKIRCRPNPWSLCLWPYLETGSLQMRLSSCLIRVGPHPTGLVSLKEDKRWRHRRMPREERGGAWHHEPRTTKDWWAAPEAGRRQGRILPRVSEGAWSRLTFQPPES